MAQVISPPINLITDGFGSFLGFLFWWNEYIGAIRGSKTDQNRFLGRLLNESIYLKIKGLILAPICGDFASK